MDYYRNKTYHVKAAYTKWLQARKTLRATRLAPCEAEKLMHVPGGGVDTHGPETILGQCI
jgi:hypothetical protein